MDDKDGGVVRHGARVGAKAKGGSVGGRAQRAGSDDWWLVSLLRPDAQTSPGVATRSDV